MKNDLESLLDQVDVEVQGEKCSSAGPAQKWFDRADEESVVRA
jgi:hypothetical protein